MPDQSEPEYFQKARVNGHVVVRDLPKFDLDAYIANYRGRSRELTASNRADAERYQEEPGLKDYFS